jgi:hypothetical protein
MGMAAPTEKVPKLNSAARFGAAPSASDVSMPSSSAACTSSMESTGFSELRMSRSTKSATCLLTPYCAVACVRSVGRWRRECCRRQHPPALDSKRHLPRQEND